MKTSVIEVRDMLSVLSVLGVEERIGKVPGVESVTVNFAAGSATVRYDETRLEIADIRSGVRQSGFEPTASDDDAASDGHEAHVATGALSASPAPAALKGSSAASATAGTAPQDKTEPSPTPKPSPAASAAIPAPTAEAPKSAPDAAPAGHQQHDKAMAAKS